MPPVIYLCALLVALTLGGPREALGHVVLTKDARGQNLVLTEEHGRASDGGQHLVIAGSGSGGHQNNMVVEDAANRDGDVLISGKSMVLPGADGHVVLVDNSPREPAAHQPLAGRQLALWLPYMQSWQPMYAMMGPGYL